MRVQWEATSYTYSEDSETVQLVMLKEGFTVSNVSVKVTTLANTATGMKGQTCDMCHNITYVLCIISVH